MNLDTLFNDKSIKTKEKTQTVSQWLLEGSLSADEFVDFAQKAKDSVKATCIEAFEFASKNKSDIVSEDAFDFVCKTLNEKAPRIKWESAKVIGNVANLHREKLDNALDGLLRNAQNEGTVVRWSAAYALGEILKLKTSHNAKLLPRLEQIAAEEEKNSIKKIYQTAFKKTLEEFRKL